MNFKNIDQQVIKKYKEDETLMIRLFVQWCKNYRLDPETLYQRAYPDQVANAALKAVIKDDDGFEELVIDDEMMLDVLQLFGNIDLAFVLTEELEKNRP
ncbi:hypothetical protein DV702_11060 [Sporosarcina sp. PTS2304]|uniref:hypothetical protein n=1 Tax=Sporosarcina sp. PTS2304 TaxID=2283194 RepID=UPI000E0CC015|nr:hypothetical protein [Sporosarcina sp. PTS2304]AXI00213.1 hypothetical protein DV702_11060 [Sporosarcina sp. PTS2304]